MALLLPFSEPAREPAATASATILMLSVQLANRPVLRAVKKWLLVMQDRINRLLQPLRIAQATLDILDG